MPTAIILETAPPLTIGATGLAAGVVARGTIKRFCEFALMTVLFTVVIAAAVSNPKCTGQHRRYGGVSGGGKGRGQRFFSRRRRCERERIPLRLMFFRQTLPWCVCRFFWRSDGDYLGGTAHLTEEMPEAISIPPANTQPDLRALAAATRAHIARKSASIRRRSAASLFAHRRARYRSAATRGLAETRRGLDRPRKRRQIWWSHRRKTEAREWSSDQIGGLARRASLLSVTSDLSACWRDRRRGHVYLHWSQRQNKGGQIGGVIRPRRYRSAAPIVAVKADRRLGGRHDYRRIIGLSCACRATSIHQLATADKNADLSCRLAHACSCRSLTASK